MKEFLKRGLISAWGGPVVLAIIFLCIGTGELTLAAAAKGILSVTVLAFIAGGMTAIYTFERLPLFPALLLHGIVLYGTYLAVYLLNGWLKTDVRPIAVFTAIFILGYALIWAIIYFTSVKKVKKLNKAIKNEV